MKLRWEKQLLWFYPFYPGSNINFEFLSHTNFSYFFFFILQNAMNSMYIRFIISYLMQRHSRMYIYFVCVSVSVKLNQSNGQKKKHNLSLRGGEWRRTNRLLYIAICAERYVLICQMHTSHGLWKFSRQNNVFLLWMCKCFCKPGKNQQIENSLQHIYIKCNTFQCCYTILALKWKKLYEAIFLQMLQYNKRYFPLLIQWHIYMQIYTHVNWSVIFLLIKYKTVYEMRWSFDSHK